MTWTADALQPWSGIVLGWLAAANAVTAALYAYDKLASRRRWRRVRERTLWAGCICGGVVGAWAAFFALRHKTRHASFWAVQTLATVAWAVALGWAALR